MGNTNSSVIKLPNGYILNKIDDCTYELVKIDDFKKGDFLFAKSRTGHVKDYVFINNGGLKANFCMRTRILLSVIQSLTFLTTMYIKGYSRTNCRYEKAFVLKIILPLLMVKLFQLPILLSALLLSMM